MKNDLENEVKKTRNQYASPPKGNAIPAGPLSDFLSDFLSRVSILTRYIDIANLSVCPSVRLSVCLSFTSRYQMKAV